MKRTLNPLAVLLASTVLVVLTGASSVSAADSQSVAIDNFAFAPGDVTVSVGSTLTWTNKQNVRHTATADDGAFDSGILASGNSFEFTFPAAGDFAYHCDIHPEMVGVVHVVAPAPVAEIAPAVEPAPAVEEAAPAVEEQPAADLEQPAPAVPAPAPAPKPASTYYGY